MPVKLLLPLLLLAMCLGSSASDVKAPKIAYVDTETALNNSREYKDCSLALLDIQDDKEEELRKMTSEIDALGDKLKVLSESKDMPLEDFLGVLRSVKAAGLDSHRIMVVVTGGEPLLRPDLEQCGKAFYDMEFPWGMVTNGFAMTPEKFRRLLRAGLRSMTVSLDGLGDDHDWMRGVPGSFERA